MKCGSQRGCASWREGATSRSRTPRKAAMTSSTTALGCDPPASTRVGEAGRAIPAVGDGEVTTSSVATPDCDPLASTHVGVARRAAPRRAMRTRRACRRRRLPRRDGGVGVSGLAPDGRMSVPWPSPVATKSRLPNQITYPAGSGSETPMGNGLDLLAIPGDQMGTKEKMSRSGPYLARQLSVP